MNYRHAYMRIISHAKSEQLQGLRPKNYNQKKNFPNQYFEFHHILPKSLFPFWKNRKTNIVPLTAREHFFCHQLLIKIYPNSFELKHCLWLMYNTRDGIHKNSKEYEKYKSIMLSRFEDPAYRKLHGEKIKASESRKRYYEKIKKETAIRRALEKEKWLAGREQRKLAGMEKRKITVANFSVEKRAEISLKHSKAAKGVPKSEDHKKKDSEAHKGAKNGMYGKSVAEVLTQKYGEEEALRVRKEKKRKISLKNSGKNNGMYGKSPANAFKVICESTEEIWSSIPKFEKATGISRGRLFRSLNNSKPIIYKGEERFFRIQKPLKKEEV